MLCQDCKKKPTCTKLCKKAEKWVNQDYRYQRELCVPEKTLEFLEWLREEKGIHDWQDIAQYFSAEKIDFPFFSEKRNKCLYVYYFKGRTYKQIASDISCKSYQVTWKQVREELRWAKKILRSMFNNQNEKNR